MLLQVEYGWTSIPKEAASRNEIKVLLSQHSTKFKGNSQGTAASRKVKILDNEYSQMNFPKVGGRWKSFVNMD